MGFQKKINKNMIGCLGDIRKGLIKEEIGRKIKPVKMFG